MVASLLNAFKYRDVVQLMTDRRAAPALQVARAYLNLSRWTGALIGTAAVVRFGVGVMSFFATGPLSGLAAYHLGDAWGGGPMLVEWMLAGLLVVAGIAAARGRSARTCRRARIVGWFVIADTVVYVASIAFELFRALVWGADPWWMPLGVVMMANAALVAMGVVVIRKATSTHRIQRDLLRGHYVRKPRLTTGTDMVW
jgi:hypothetical protein